MAWRGRFEQEPVEYSSLSELVYKIVSKYLQGDGANTTLEDFKSKFTWENAYPYEGRGNWFIISVEDYDSLPDNSDKRNRYWRGGTLSIDGNDYYISNQWGVATGLRGDFIPFERFAKEQLGYTFTRYKKNSPENNQTDVHDESENTVEQLIAAGLKTRKQIVLTGAPGTGKTYAVKRYVRAAIVDSLPEDTGTEAEAEAEMEAENNAIEKQQCFVQFHPSYDYSDFVEGLRPVLLEGNTAPTFVRLDGTFKAFCRQIVMENASELGIDSWDAAAYKDSEDDATTPYYFIIDEINRADLSKVFGELMFCLEGSYRGIDNRVKTQYENLPTYEVDSSTGYAKRLDVDCFKDGFFIPNNLYIIGTMNDIDRSVEAFDFALRRRFEWIEVEANAVMESVLCSIAKQNGELTPAVTQEIQRASDSIKQMNEVISGEVGQRLGLSAAYHIGPAYFCALDFRAGEAIRNQLERIFDGNIRSILREYTRGRKVTEAEHFIESCRTRLLLEVKTNEDAAEPAAQDENADGQAAGAVELGEEAQDGNQP